MELKATRYDVSDGVAVVTLARPKRRNAWTGRMHTEYRWILREADRDPAVGKPIIAAINGAAAGVGLVLAAYADLRFCVPGAKFTAAHGRFNFPVEYGLSWLLPRIVGLTHANDILLSSRVFTAEEADRMGFLNRIVPPEALMDEVMAYARNLARTVAPGSARESKRQIYRDLHRDAAGSVKVAEALLVEMSKTPDYREGVKAWMEKRPPAWSG